MARSTQSLFFGLESLVPTPGTRSWRLHSALWWTVLQNVPCTYSTDFIGHVATSTYTKPRKIKQELISSYAQAPAMIVYHPEDVRDPAVPATTLYCRIICRLEYLQNLFLLDRLLIRRGHSHAQELIDIGREMLSLTLMLWKHKDHFAGVHSDFEWIVRFAVRCVNSMPWSLQRLLDQQKSKRHLTHQFFRRS